MDHGSPDGSVSSPAKHADGTLFKPAENKLDELEDLLALVKEVVIG